MFLFFAIGGLQRVMIDGISAGHLATDQFEFRIMSLRDTLIFFKFVYGNERYQRGLRTYFIK